jgi:hypothetical protein
MVDIIGTDLVAFASCRAATSPSAVGNVGSAIEVLFLTLARVDARASALGECIIRSTAVCGSGAI